MEREEEVEEGEEEKVERGKHVSRFRGVIHAHIHTLQLRGDEEPKMSEEELLRKKEKKMRNKEEKQMKRREFLQKVKAGQRVVIDLGFEDKMTEQEVRSNVQQVMYIYGENKKCSRPFNITLSDLHGETRKGLEKIDAFEDWPFHKETRPYIELFDAEELVYLTADSPNTITTFDSSKVYIVGGIVDRNRYKSLTFDKAQKQGIQTAKLPIGKFLKLSSTKVLTTYHVLSIMMNFNVSGDWSEAFEKTIPTRKKLISKKKKKKRRINTATTTTVTTPFDNGGVYANLNSQNYRPSEKKKKRKDSSAFGCSYDELEILYGKQGGGFVRSALL